MTAELVDRFGPLPEPASHLLRLAGLRLTCRALGVRRLDLGPAGGSVQFEETHQVDPAIVIKLIHKESREYRLEGPSKLRISRPLPKTEARFEFATGLLDRLRGPDKLRR